MSAAAPQPQRPAERSDFKVAIYCALPTESNAIVPIMDTIWPHAAAAYGKAQGDTNTYLMGSIGHHAVVVVFGGMGNLDASIAAGGLRSSFSGIQLCLVVGICGAKPIFEKRDVFLGDVVISTAVVQFDYGRRLEEALIARRDLTAVHGRPCPALRNFLHLLENEQIQPAIRQSMSTSLQNFLSHPVLGDSVPSPGVDNSCPTAVRHKHYVTGTCAECLAEIPQHCTTAPGLSCNELGCNTRDGVRSRLPGNLPLGHLPALHMGYIGSSNQVMRSASHRDLYANEFNLVAYEMEGVSFWDLMPTMIIKAVCDYADDHKNKVWQRYASLRAAVCAKAIVSLFQVMEGPETRPPEERGGSVFDNRYATISNQGYNQHFHAFNAR